MPRPSEALEIGVLAIGQRLEIGFGEDVVDWLPSRLNDHDDDRQRLVVAWPTDHDRRLIAVKPGHMLQLSASTPNDAVYSALVSVESTSREGVPLLTLRVTGQWRRTQRRDAVRMSVVVRPRMAHRVLGDLRKPLRLGVTNISGGGLQVQSEDELHLGDRLELALELMGIDDEIEIKARVARVSRLDLGSVAVWDAGCEFEEMPGRLVERIVQFIFRQQRALARVKRG